MASQSRSRTYLVSRDTLSLRQFLFYLFIHFYFYFLPLFYFVVATYSVRTAIEILGYSVHDQCSTAAKTNVCTVVGFGGYQHLNRLIFYKTQ